MTELKATKGPWVVCGDGTHIKPEPQDHFLQPIADARPVIRWVNGNWERDDNNEVAANAHLIAAAPDLYEALEAFVAKIDHVVLVEDDHPHSDLAGELRRALEALQSARGDA